MKSVIFSVAAMGVFVTMSWGAFAPSDLAGLTLWLKSDSGVVDYNGITPGNGAFVTRWFDQSGQGNDLVATGDSTKPYYRLDDIAGYPAVSNAASHYMIFANGKALAAQSIFVVGRPIASTDSSPLVLFADTKTIAGKLTDLFIRHSSPDSISLDGTRTTLVKGTCSLGGEYLTAPYGKTSYSFTAPDGIIPSPFLLHVEYQDCQTFEQILRRNTDYFYKGTLCEIIVFNRPLAETERQQIGYYLQSKYALSGTYVEPSEFYVRTISATKVADTHATLSGNAGGVAEGTRVELRIYYGTTDGTGNAEAWDAYEVVAESLQDEVTYHHLLQGLTVDTAYYYRFAAVAGDTLKFSKDSGSFTTRALDYPATFRRQGDAYAEANWNDTVWINLDNLERTMPGSVIGDRIDLQPTDRNHSVTLVLTNDVTLAGVSCGHVNSSSSGEYSIGGTNSFTGGELPVKLVFDSGDPTIPVEFNTRGTGYIGFGTSLTDTLTIQLNNPLTITRSNANTCVVFMQSPITGGTEAAPATISCSDYVTGSFLHICPANPNNTFRGDWIMDRATPSANAPSCTLFVGRPNPSPMLRANDAVLGHLSNKVILRNDTRFILHGVAGDAAFELKHSVFGFGSIERVIQNSSFSNTDTLGLIFGDSIMLSPGEGTTYGKLTVLAKAITAKPASTMKFKVGPDGNDSIYFSGRANALINANIEIIPQGKVTSGMSWPIMTVHTSVPTFTLEPSAITPHYRLHSVADANGLTIYATYDHPPTLMQIY